MFKFGLFFMRNTRIYQAMGAVLQWNTHGFCSQADLALKHD